MKTFAILYDKLHSKCYKRRDISTLCLESFFFNGYMFTAN